MIAERKEAEMKKKELTCGSCVYYERTKGGDIDVGECYRYPPTGFMFPVVHPVTGQTGTTCRSMYPPVKLGARACGEYKARLNTVDNED